MNVELVRDELGDLGMGVIAGEMLDNPPFYSFRKPPHRVSSG